MTRIAEVTDSASPSDASMSALAVRLSGLPPGEAAEALRDVIRSDDDLIAQNRLAPYEDILPLALVEVPARRMALALDRLSAGDVCRVLFGNFRVVPEKRLAAIMGALARPSLAALLDEMAIGFDLPRQAAHLLSLAGPGPVRALLDADPMAATRIAALMKGEVIGSALAALDEQSLLPWLSRAIDVATTADLFRLKDSLGWFPEPFLSAVLAGVAEDRARTLRAQLALPLNPAWDCLGLLAAIERIGSMEPTEAATGLIGMRARCQVAVAAAMPAAHAARVLATLAVTEPVVAGALLAALTEVVLVRDPQGRLAHVAHRARTAAVLEHLDAADPAVGALVDHSEPSRPHRLPLQGRGRRAAQGRSSPVAYPMTQCTGRRRSVALVHGMRWVQLRETVTVDGRSRPLRVDLLELDLSRARLQACREPDPGPRLHVADVASVVGQASRHGSSPGEAVFRRLGMVRLATAVARQGAVAGINGNFYFDYGHHIDARDLGLDLSAEPMLYFGDAPGWFVADGQELSPPVFNRSVLVATADGSAHVRRVGMRAVTLADARRVTWESVNHPQSGGVTLYNRVAGAATARSRDVVDLAVSGTTIVGVRPGGGSPIPLLGFVLAIPTQQAAGLLAGVGSGDRVRVETTFPSELGRVDQAMACGPQLVRDGQVDLDLDIEEFGTKDSSVLPLSLTRTVDSFRAARSFAFLRHSRLVLGTVAGTLLGNGPPRVSAGMTFAELAQLCVDLGADDAMGLDGGGSSSLVALVDGAPRVLGVPTGGADVPEGTERFIKTYWLVYGKGHQSG